MVVAVLVVLLDDHFDLGSGSGDDPMKQNWSNEEDGYYLRSSSFVGIRISIWFHSFLKILSMENTTPSSLESQGEKYSIINTHMLLLVRIIKWIFWTTVIIYILSIGYKFYVTEAVKFMPQNFLTSGYLESFIKFGWYLTLVLTLIVGFQLWKNGIGRIQLGKGILLITIILFILFWYQGPNLKLLNPAHPTCVGSPYCLAIGRPFRSRKWFRRWSHEAELIKWGGWVLSKSSV